MGKILMDPYYEYTQEHIAYYLKYYVGYLENEELIECVINGPGIKENFVFVPLCGSCHQDDTSYKLRNSIPLTFSDSDSDSDSNEEAEQVEPDVRVPPDSWEDEYD